MDLAYTRTSSKPFDQLAAAVEESAARHNFRTLHVHDVQATLAEKGFEIGPYRIVEVCNAGFAFKAITAYKPVGMMLPCRIVVFEDQGLNTVMLMLPGIMKDMLPEADLGTLPEDVEKILREVVDEVVA